MSDLIKIAGVEFYELTQKIYITTSTSANLFQLKDKEYRYDQLESYEYVENQGTVVRSGGIGRAIVGGILFGGAGAVVGASTGKRSMDTIISEMAVRLTFRVGGTLKTEKVLLNDFNEVQFGSMKYEKYLNKAKQLMDKLDQITQKMQQRTTVPTAPMVNGTVQPAIDMKAKLLELKELYEQGLLDEQEYKEEKKAFLESQRNAPALPQETFTAIETGSVLSSCEQDGGQTVSDVVEYIKSHYDSSSKIKAISYYREYTGAGIKDAKEAVEKIFQEISMYQG